MSSSWDSWLYASQKSKPGPIDSPTGPCCRWRPSEPLGLQSDQPQAGEATPVLGEEGAGIVDVRVEEELDIRDVLGVGVVPRVGRFVRATEADQIRSEYPIPGRSRVGIIRR